MNKFLEILFAIGNALMCRACPNECEQGWIDIGGGQHLRCRPCAYRERI